MKYTQQFLFILKNELSTINEIFLLEAYKLKWIKTQKDPIHSRLHIIKLDGTEDIHNAKFACLKLADSQSRITLIAHHKLGTDYFYFDKEKKFSYQKFIDIIRENVTSPSVFITPQIAIQHEQRALRITYSACNVGVRLKGISLAEKIFDYASNHKTKPLKIEMTAPNMFCIPMLADKKAKISRFNIPPPNTKHIHKRYLTLPYYAGKFFLFKNSAGLFSFIYPKYRPHRYKTILKIDYSVSLFGKVKPKRSYPHKVETAHRRKK